MDIETQVDDLWNDIQEITDPDNMSLSEAVDYYNDLISRCQTMRDALDSDLKRLNS